MCSGVSVIPQDLLGFRAIVSFLETLSETLRDEYQYYEDYTGGSLLQAFRNDAGPEAQMHKSCMKGIESLAFEAGVKPYRLQHCIPDEQTASQYAVLDPVRLTTSVHRSILGDCGD